MLFVLLYVHLKNDVFSISLPFPLYQVNTLSLPNVFTSLVNFLTACKKLWRPCVVAGASDSNNSKLYSILLTHRLFIWQPFLFLLDGALWRSWRYQVEAIRIAQRVNPRIPTRRAFHFQRKNRIRKNHFHVRILPRSVYASKLIFCFIARTEIYPFFRQSFYWKFTSQR